VCKGGKDGERDELDVELKLIIPLLHNLIINWWQSRVPVISFLWDCFHKRLNQPFLLQISGPWTLSLEKYTNKSYKFIITYTLKYLYKIFFNRKTAVDILKQINDRIYGRFEYSKESSYSIFLYLIGKFNTKIFYAFI